jgi:hypothetical protein
VLYNPQLAEEFQNRAEKKCAKPCPDKGKPGDLSPDSRNKDRGFVYEN